MAIDIEVTGDMVVVNLTGPDRVFALKGRLAIPAEKISSVEVLPRRDLRLGSGIWIRLPGTFVPGLIRHGSYGIGANREFWAISRQDDVLVISVDEWDYRRLILGTGNPAIDAMKITPLV